MAGTLLPSATATRRSKLSWQAQAKESLVSHKLQVLPRLSHRKSRDGFGPHVLGKRHLEATGKARQIQDERPSVFSSFERLCPLGVWAGPCYRTRAAYGLM